MNEQDRELAEALLAEDAELGGAGQAEESVLRDVVSTFRGVRGKYTIFAWFWGFVFGVLMVYAGYRFFTGEEIGARLDWGLICVFSIVANGLIKIWAWMEIQRVGVQRSLKRIEVRLALLADRKE